MTEHGGAIREMSITDYSVFIGHHSGKEKEGSGWVFGNSEVWQGFRDSLSSSWLKDRLTVGASFSGAELAQLEREIQSISTSQMNIDDENVKDALLYLIAAAKSDGGRIYVQ